MEGEACGNGSGGPGKRERRKSMPVIGYCKYESVLLFYDIDMKVGTVTRSSRPRKDTACVKIGKYSMYE